MTMITPRCPEPARLCRVCGTPYRAGTPTTPSEAEPGSVVQTHMGAQHKRQHNRQSYYGRESRDLDRSFAEKCNRCGSFNIIHHPELFDLSIAHVDCDAFFATVEKRDRPELRGHPVIVGGGARGVVAAACYSARAYGVRSAMPMFKALRKCPHAAVISPDFEKYRRVSRKIRTRFQGLTPLIEPVSIDEAFLDLSGTARLHKASPATLLVRLARDIRQDLGISVSIGLSHNKLLAKIASDMDKPNGFFVIGVKETVSFLAPHPISLIAGIGPVMQRKLARHGYQTIGDLQHADPKHLTRYFGQYGAQLYSLAQGRDSRPVRPGGRDAKSISSETTFARDLTSFEALTDILWPLCEKISRRLKKEGVNGTVITVKLRRADFQVISRRRTLSRPSNLAGILFETGRSLLKTACNDMCGPYRLIGLEVANLVSLDQEAQYTFFHTPYARLESREKAIDTLRERFGDNIISTGRSFSRRKPHGTRRIFEGE